MLRPHWSVHLLSLMSQFLATLTVTVFKCSCCFRLSSTVSPIDFVLDTSAHVSEFVVGRLIADTSQFSSINSVLDPMSTMLHFRLQGSISLQVEFNRTWRFSTFLPVIRTDVSSANLKLFLCVAKMSLNKITNRRGDIILPWGALTLLQSIPI